MALTCFIIALFALLVNLALAGTAVFDDTNVCWNMAVKLSGCGDDSSTNPDVCLCRSAGIVEIFAQLAEYCAQNGQLDGFTPDQVCANLVHAREAAPAVTALALRTALAAPTTTMPSHKSWMSDGFCGLPGTFCAGGVADEVAELDQVQDAAPAVTALAVRTALAAATTTTTVFNPHPLSPGFCGLPGTFCSFEDDVAEEADLPAIAITARTALAAASTTTEFTPHPLSPGFCGLPGTFCSSEDDVVDEAELPAITIIAPRVPEPTTISTTWTQSGATPSFENPRPYGFPPMAGYPTMAPAKRSDDEGVLPLKADTMGNVAASKVMGGLKIALGFVIGWIGALMVI